jgi:hypothetical protein
VTIVPDTKDWTWVLDRPCPECGLDTQRFAREAIVGMMRVNAAAWQDVLTGPGDPRRRPTPSVWSALEYGCHVRDVHRLYDERLTMMLTRDAPEYPDWDQAPRPSSVITPSRIRAGHPGRSRRAGTGPGRGTR